MIQKQTVTGYLHISFVKGYRIGYFSNYIQIWLETEYFLILIIIYQYNSKNVRWQWQFLKDDDDNAGDQQEQIEDQISEDLEEKVKMLKVMNKLLVSQIIQDKKVIKIQIAITQLKQEKHQDALAELYETEDLEIKVYGEGSLQVSKTQMIKRNSNLIQNDLSRRQIKDQMCKGNQRERQILFNLKVKQNLMQDY